MIDPVVRRAEPADADQLQALEAAARAALVDQRGGARWLEEHPPRRWEGPTGEVVFVADLDDVVVGYLVLEIGADGVARVESVYVLPDARELGFGDELLAHALDHARAAGARLLEATALPGDRDTKNLYERAGITARSITVSTAL